VFGNFASLDFIIFYIYMTMMMMMLLSGTCHHKDQLYNYRRQNKARKDREKMVLQSSKMYPEMVGNFGQFIGY